MALYISGQDHRERSVSGHVAGCSKAVLKRKDGEHQGGSRSVESKDSRNQTQRGHNRSSRNPRRSYRKNPKPGSRKKQFPAGEYEVPCALIIGKRKASTDLKTSLNSALREFDVPV